MPIFPETTFEHSSNHTEESSDTNHAVILQINLPRKAKKKIPGKRFFAKFREKEHDLKESRKKKDGRRERDRSRDGSRICIASR